MRHLFTRIENVDSVTIAPYQVLFKLYDCRMVIYEFRELAKKRIPNKGLALITFSKRINGNTFVSVSRVCFINPDTTAWDMELIWETWL